MTSSHIPIGAESDRSVLDGQFTDMDYRTERTIFIGLSEVLYNFVDFTEKPLSLEDFSRWLRQCVSDGCISLTSFTSAVVIAKRLQASFPFTASNLRTNLMSCFVLGEKSCEDNFIHPLHLVNVFKAGASKRMIMQLQLAMLDSIDWRVEVFPDEHHAVMKAALERGAWLVKQRIIVASSGPVFIARPLPGDKAREKRREERERARVKIVREEQKKAAEAAAAAAAPAAAPVHRVAEVPSQNTQAVPSSNTQVQTQVQASSQSRVLQDQRAQTAAAVQTQRSQLMQPTHQTHQAHQAQQAQQQRTQVLLQPMRRANGMAGTTGPVAGKTSMERRSLYVSSAATAKGHQQDAAHGQNGDSAWWQGFVFRAGA